MIFIKMFFVRALAAVALASCVHSVHANRVDNSTRQRGGELVESFERQRAFLAAAAIAALEPRVQRAEELSIAGEPGHSELRREIAFGYSKVLEWKRADDVLSQVIADPETQFDLAEALRMRGQYRLRSDRMKEAERDFAECLDIYDRNPDMKERFGIMYLSAVQQYTFLLAEQKRGAEAALHQTRCFLQNVQFPDRQARSSALAEQARYLELAGKRAEAAAVLDQLIADDPAFGKANGLGIILRLRRVELSTEPNSPERLHRLTDLWNEPGLASSARSIDIGMAMVRAYQAAVGVHAGVRAADQVLARIDHFRAAPPDADHGGPLVEKDAREGEQTLLSIMSSCDDIEVIDFKIKALRRLLPSARNASEQASFLDQLTRAEAAAAAR